MMSLKVNIVWQKKYGKNKKTRKLLSKKLAMNVVLMLNLIMTDKYFAKINSIKILKAKMLVKKISVLFVVIHLQIILTKRMLMIA